MALAVTLGSFLAVGSAQADSTSSDVAEMKREILNLKHKIERLEKSRPSPREAKSNTVASQPIILSGLVELEASYSDGPTGDESDLRVATV